MTNTSLHMGQFRAAPLPGRILAPIERRIGKLAMARLYSIFDQGASGLANVIALAILGRALPVSQFGAIGLMIGLHYFVAGFHRSAIVLPYLTEHHEAPTSAAGHEECTAWWWLSLAAALALSALLAAGGLALWAVAPVFPALHWMVAPMLLAAVVTPAMLAAEFARRWLFKIERADLVALNALLYFCLLTGAALAAAKMGNNATAGAAAWAIASLGAIVMPLAVLRPGRVDREGIARIISAHRTEAGWLAWANLPYSVFSSATIVIPIGAIIGPVAAGVFTAARTLTNPAMSIVSAIDSTDKPRATRALAERGLSGLRHAIGRTRMLIALATGTYLGALALWAEPIARFAFHGHYADVSTEVRLLALAFFLAGLNQPAETQLIVLRRGRAMLLVRSAVAIAALVALLFAAPFGVTGMAAGVATIQALNLLLLAIACRHAIRKVSRHA